MKSYIALSVRLRHVPCLALPAVAFSAFLAVICSNGYSVELIRNGSFEENRFTGFPRSEGWDDGPGISSDIGFVVRQYPEGDCGAEGWCSGDLDFVTPGPPSSGVSGPVGRGRFYASDFGRANGQPPQEIFGSATQHVDLAGHAGSPFEFSVWLTSSPFDTDYAIVSLEFFAEANATADSLGIIEFDGNDQQSTFIFGSANEQGLADPTVPATKANWTFYRAIGTFPVNAASAAVVLRDGTVAGGSANNGYLDLVSLRMETDLASIPGDYNGDNAVEQEDLDLVLLNWGNDAIVAPDGWIRNFPTGAVDQAELDAVLLNWGNTQPPVNGVGAIPEPATMSLVLAVLPLVVAIRHTHAQRRNSIVGA